MLNNGCNSGTEQYHICGIVVFVVDDFLKWNTMIPYLSKYDLEFLN